MIDIETREVNKISSRLDLWIKRPNQINSKILQEFLRLQEVQSTPITIKQFTIRLKGMKTFKSNFNQMKIISDKNHGKIFDVDENEVLTLWEPVSSLIISKKNDLLNS